MLPLVAMYESQVIPKDIKTNYCALTKTHIQYLEKVQIIKIKNKKRQMQASVKSIPNGKCQITTNQSFAPTKVAKRVCLTLDHSPSLSCSSSLQPHKWASVGGIEIGLK